MAISNIKLANLNHAVNGLQKAVDGLKAPAAKTGFDTQDTFKAAAPAAKPQAAKAEAKPKDEHKGLDFLKDLPKLIGSFLQMFTGGGGGGGLGGLLKAGMSLFGLGGGGGGGLGGLGGLLGGLF
jgi:hypothetical protein